MGITNWSIKHSVTIFVFMLCLIIAGLGAYNGLPREAQPDITIPYVNITVPYFGVSPADIETLVTNPLEEELEQLKDVEEVRSVSAEGASIITIEFKPNVDMDTALSDVRERVDLARPELPSDAEDPIITEISFSDFPIMNITLSGNTGLVQLYAVAELLEEDINRIKGILDVTIVGGLEREIRVEPDPALLEYYNVSFNELIGVVQNENVNIPGGSIDVGDQAFLVRTPGEFERVTEIENLVVREEDGMAIYVRDVAQVIDGYEDAETYSRINQTQAVSVVITRRAGENILRITEEIRTLLDDYRHTYEGSVDFAVLDDVSDQIRLQLSELENNILTGLLLVLVVLLFFLSGWKRALITIGAATAFVIVGMLLSGLLGFSDASPLRNPWVYVSIALLVGFFWDRDGGLRTALFVATAIPFSMLISFAVLAALGITLNIVVLFSLVLALGMLVDNAIVIVENVYRHMTMGKDSVQAAMDAVAEVAWPVIASTATTVGAFVPMLFWPGLMGEFMKYLPLTVIVVLSSSLFVALVINPVLCATLMRIAPELVGTADDDGLDETRGLPDNFVYRAYRATLDFATGSRIGTYTVIGGSMAMLVASLMIFGAANTGTEFFPETTPERIKINVDLPDGSNVDASDRIVRQIENVVGDDAMAMHVVAAVGAGNGSDMGGSTNGTAHQSRLSIEFVDPEDQEMSVDEYILEIRAFLDTIAGAEFEVVREENGPPTGAPINLEIVGEEYEVLQELAGDAERIIGNIEGVVDLKVDFETGRQELAVRVDRQLAGVLGLSTMEIANTVRAAVNGIEASVYRENDEEYDIYVRLPEEHRSSIADVGRLWIKTDDGRRVQIQEVADLVVQQGYGSIRHLDSERVVTISAEAAEGFNENAVLLEAQQAIAEAFEVPAGYLFQWTGQNEEQADAQAFLSSALLAALFIIALVLITQFNSVIQPGIILFAVILSLIGVFLTLTVRQMPLSIIMTGVGIISLAGVVVNNAIVLVDYTNQLRERGLKAREAIVMAGLVRFRPVLLTAITTILSLLPTVIGYSLDAKQFRIVAGGTSVEMWGPMANAVVGGLTVATVLTLVVVPALYMATEDLNRLFGKLVGIFTKNSEEAYAGATPNRTQPITPAGAHTRDAALTDHTALPETGGSQA